MAEHNVTTPMRIASPPFSPVVVAKRRRRRQDKAPAGRATEAYLTVRRGARPSATQYWRMDPALQQTTGEKCGLGACAAEESRYSMSTLSAAHIQYVVVTVAQNRSAAQTPSSSDGDRPRL